MFAPLLQSTARKKIPNIIEVKGKIYQSLLNLISIQSLEQDLEVLQKALECRKADILKAEETKQYEKKFKNEVVDNSLSNIFNKSKINNFFKNFIN